MCVCVCYLSLLRLSPGFIVIQNQYRGYGDKYFVHIVEVMLRQDICEKLAVFDTRGRRHSAIQMLEPVTYY